MKLKINIFENATLVDVTSFDDLDTSNCTSLMSDNLLLPLSSLNRFNTSSPISSDSFLLPVLPKMVTTLIVNEILKRGLQ